MGEGREGGTERREPESGRVRRGCEGRATRADRPGGAAADAPLCAAACADASRGAPEGRPQALALAPAAAKGQAGRAHQRDGPKRRASRPPAAPASPPSPAATGPPVVKGGRGAVRGPLRKARAMRGTWCSAAKCRALRRRGRGRTRAATRTALLPALLLPPAPAPAGPAAPAAPAHLAVRAQVGEGALQQAGGQHLGDAAGTHRGKCRSHEGGFSRPGQLRQASRRCAEPLRRAAAAAAAAAAATAITAVPTPLHCASRRTCTALPGRRRRPGCCPGRAGSRP